MKAFILAHKGKLIAAASLAAVISLALKLKKKKDLGHKPSAGAIPVV